GGSVSLMGYGSGTSSFAICSTARARRCRGREHPAPSPGSAGLVVGDRRILTPPPSVVHRGENRETFPDFLSGGGRRLDGQVRGRRTLTNEVDHVAAQYRGTEPPGAGAHADRTLAGALAALPPGQPRPRRLRRPVEPGGQGRGGKRLPAAERE